MTKVYFVRHAQPDFGWEDDRTRPLTAEGESGFQGSCGVFERQAD